MIQALEKLEKLNELDPLVIVDYMIAHKKEYKKYYRKSQKNLWAHLYFSREKQEKASK